MKDRYHLEGVRDDDLVRTLPVLVQRYHDYSAELLAHLAELEARQLYDAMGFSSMWKYVTEGLGMCQTTAWRKLAAARVCRTFPGNFERIARGELSVSVLAALSEHLTPANSSELLAKCVGMSFRDAELLIAERFPKPDLSDSIRRKPDRTSSWPAGASVPGVEASTSDVESADDTGGAAEGPAKPPRPPASRPQRPIEPIARDRFAVRFTADGEFVALLDQVRDLAAHRGSGDLLTVLKAGLEAYQRELLKQRFGVGRTPRQSGGGTTATKPEPSSEASENIEPKPESEPVPGPKPQKPRKPRKRRHIPIAVAREVYARDEGRCTFVSADGRRCSARRKLELDHIDPDALVDDDTPANLRMRCQTHNQLAARDYFGKGYMRAVMKRVRADAKEKDEDEPPANPRRKRRERRP